MTSEPRRRSTSRPRGEHNDGKEDRVSDTVYYTVPTMNPQIHMPRPVSTAAPFHHSRNTSTASFDGLPSPPPLLKMDSTPTGTTPISTRPSSAIGGVLDPDHESFFDLVNRRSVHWSGGSEGEGVGIRWSKRRTSITSPPKRPISRPTSRPTSATGRRKWEILRRFRSTALPEGSVIEKPWMAKKDPRSWLAYLSTMLLMVAGVGLSVLACFRGVNSVQRLENNLCLVMEDQFDTLDTDTWRHEVDLGGFGNGEFEMMTSSPNNSFVQDGILYIVPTLTSDIIGRDSVLNGYTYNLTGCTNTNLTACGVISNSTTKTVINPVQSARLTTQNSHSLRYGKIEVRAKIPKGDWLWPAIWMLPVNNTYGPWPMSGEIDIMESRGNDASYPAQGRNFVHGSLNWGPLSFLNAGWRTTGWWEIVRTDYSKDFHLYSVEWTQDWIRIYVDNRIKSTLYLKLNKESFFERGQFPPVVFNGTGQISLPNPWKGRGNSAPFDQDFYLILDVAVGGTAGWFPDNVAKKPWLDGSLAAMYDFATAQDTWSATWPQDVTERGMAIDYVRMWRIC